MNRNDKSIMKCKDKISKNIDEIYDRHLEEYKKRMSRDKGFLPDKETTGWVASIYSLFIQVFW